MTSRQDLDASRTTELKVTEAPEEAFLRLLEAEDKEGESTPPVSQPEPQPTPDPANSEDDSEETVEEATDAPDEVDSEDPQEEEDSEDPSETDEVQEEEPDALYRVVANGEEHNVTLDELTRGYSRESDYTRQKQELIEQQRQFGEEVVSARAERAKYQGMLGQLEDAVKQTLPQEPDWAKLRAENPADFAATYATWTQQQGNLQKIQEERQRVQQQEYADISQQQEKIIRDEQEKLLHELPDLGDSEKGPQIQAAMLKTAESVGYSTDDLSAVIDSRAIRLLHYATLYLQLKASKPARTKRTKTTKTVKPGARTRTPTRSKSRDAQNRLKKSGTVEDAAAVFLADINTKR